MIDIKKIFSNNKEEVQISNVEDGSLKIVTGTNKKPAITSELLEFFKENYSNIEGYLYTGYPILGTYNKRKAFDAVLISKKHGIVAFDLDISQDTNNYESNQDDIYNSINSYLRQNSGLTNKRELLVNISTITIAPNLKKESKDISYPAINKVENIKNILDNIEWNNPEKYKELLSTIQNITSIRVKNDRTVKKHDSRGAILKKLEDEIANLDRTQAEAVVNTFDGVQRIRGLAGSGKTIVLALKVAYLHANNEDWNIAVTFNTRSLKKQFESLVTRFVIEQKKQEPDWSKISILHAWGSSDMDGIYYNFCKENGEEYLDFNSAKQLFGYDNAFFGACNKALQNCTSIEEKYDAILIDEAQDFASGSSAPFLTLCYKLLKSPKRLIFAYDELQNLSMKSMPSPEEIFGISDEEYKDLTLPTCYRNSRPVLSTAHSLGFGVYHKQGLIQLFEDTSIWESVGYQLLEGELKENSNISLSRTESGSPKFLEELGPKNDLIKFKQFNSIDDQIEYLVNDIEKNLKEEELDPRDIIVIHTDPLTTKDATAKARSMLYEKNINCSLAGVSSSPDIFQEKDSITFSGIYRAKGNEAGMVYIINSDYCYNSDSLAQKRNILFTAITRSKAWVRVLGVGPQMKELTEEYNQLKNNDFKLKFKYPSSEDMRKMILSHRERTKSEKGFIKSANDGLNMLMTSLESGLTIDELNLKPEDIKRLREIIKKDDN